MSYIASFSQRVIEKKRYTVGYQKWLDDGETLFDFTIQISPDTDTPLEASGGFTSDGDQEITFFLAGGEAGQQYNVDLIATTTDGQIKEDTVKLGVRA